MRQKIPTSDMSAANERKSAPQRMAVLYIGASDLPVQDAADQESHFET